MGTDLLTLVGALAGGRNLLQTPIRRWWRTSDGRNHRNGNRAHAQCRPDAAHLSLALAVGRDLRLQPGVPRQRPAHTARQVLSVFLLPILLLSDGFNFFVGVVFAAIHTRTTGSDVIPFAVAGQIHRPEWIGAALQRAHWIDRAHPLAIFILQKNTVTVGPLGKAVTGEDAAQVLLVHRFDGHTRKFADPANLFRTHPYVSRGASATIPTLRALKI